MSQHRQRRSWTALILLCLLFVGCNDFDDNFSGSSTMPVNNNPVNDFALKQDVRVLDPSITVVNITDTDVTLEGDLSGISVGQVIIANSGEQTFTRRVTAINGQVLSTTQVDITDIFQDANITRVEKIPPEVLAQMQPNLPGLSISTSSTLNRVSNEELEDGVFLNFANVPLKQNGSTVAFLNGQLRVDVAVEPTLRVNNGVGQLSMNQVGHVEGALRVRLIANSQLQTNLYLTTPVTHQLANLGPLPVFSELQLSLDLRGALESGATILFETDPEGSGNTAQVTTTYDFAGTETDLAATFDRDWSATSPTLADGAQISLQGSLCTVNSRLSFLGASKVTGSNYRFPLMGIFCRSGLDTQNGREGTKVEIFDTFLPIQWDTLNEGRNDEYRRREASVDGRLIMLDFRPAFNPPTGSITNLRVTPSTPLELHVGQSVNISVRADLSGTGGAASNAPLVLDWDLLPGAASRVEFSSTHGTSVKVKGVSPGITFITATYEGIDQLVTLQVTVRPSAIEGLSITNNDQTFVLGDYDEQVDLARGELDLTPRVLMTDGTTFEPDPADVVWLSTDPDTVEIDGPGHAILKKPGTATLTASFGALTAERRLQVVAPLAGALAISPFPPAQLALGESLQMNALVSFADNSRRRITSEVLWATTLSDVLAVDQTGLVSGVGRGVSFLTALFRGAAGAARFNVDTQPVVALQIIPDDFTIAEGQLQDLQVFATFADGSFAEISQTEQIDFAVPAGSGIIVNPATSQVGGLFPGEFELTASYGGKTVNATALVTGPQLLAITGQPAGPVAPGTTFPLMLQMQDVDGNPRPSAVERDVLVTVTGATLTGGTGIIPAGSSSATLNLSIDEPGIYTLRVLVDGLNRAESQPITIVSAASIGKIITTVQVGGQRVGLAVADLRPSGEVVPVAGSPFTASAPLDPIHRLGDFLFATEIVGGITGNYALETFSFDVATGALAAQSTITLFPTFAGEDAVITSNGVDRLFVATANSDAATGNQLTALQVDPETGAVLNRVDQALSPQTALATFFRAGAMTVLSGPSSDLVLVSGISGRSPVLLPKVEQAQVQVFGYNRAVNPPTLTLLGTTDLDLGPPDPIFRHLPTSSALIGNRLYVGCTFENDAGQIQRLDLTPATGALSNQATAFDFTVLGDNPSDLVPLTHPVLGSMMISTSPLTSFDVEADGDLALVNRGDLSGGFLELFVDPTDGRQILMGYFANSLVAHLVDPVTGAIDLLRTTSGFQNADYLAR